MKTLLDFPRPRGPHTHEPVEVIFWSVFDDVTALWSVLDPEGELDRR